MRRLILLSILLSALAGCASAGGQKSAPSAATSPRQVLTQEEILAAGGVATALDAVRRLRPQFIRSRGVTSLRNPTADQVVVYVNGIRAGGVQALEQIPAQDVREIRHVNARDATTKYGTGHTGGVLEVITG